MKQTLTSHDVQILVRDLERILVGLRLQNVYDITNRLFCLKFQNKEILFIESGMRFHLSKTFEHSVRPMPSCFAMKLRKHLRNKRLTAMRQVNFDRVVECTFGEGEFTCRLILEFYASGNIILTDADYKILMVLHQHVYETEGCVVKIGETYPFDSATQALPDITSTSIVNWVKEHVNKIAKTSNIKQLLISSQLIVFGPALIEHALVTSGVNPKQKVSQENLPHVLEQVLNISNLQKTITLLYQMVESSKDLEVEGYIFRDKDGNVQSFTPMLYAQDKEKEYERYETFSEAIATYFSGNDSDKLEKAEEKFTKKAVKGREATQDQKRSNNLSYQIANLNKRVEKYEDEIEYLWPLVDVLQEVIDTRVSQPPFTIEKISYEKKTMNVTTENGATYLIDYTKSAQKNLSDLHTTRKKTTAKLSRAETVVLKPTKRKSERQELITIPPRKKKWFEEYHWFFTSDNHLVVLGRNAEQNERLVKHHMDPHDLYLHSEVAGSGSGVVKMNGKEDTLSVKSFEEAGTFVIMFTKAWKDGSPDKPYWVYPNQVSKTTESGEYVQTGSFIIRGKRNFLPLPKLIAGFGIRFERKEGEIVDVMATCGPYSAIADLKYKVKIVPGTQKVTKTLKSVVGRFIGTTNDVTEKSFLASITADEIQNVCMNSIRVL